MHSAASSPLRILRTLLHADHALVFARRQGGDVALVVADPPQLPSQPFSLADARYWPSDTHPLLLTTTREVQESPVGWVLPRAHGTVVAVSSRTILMPEALPAGTEALATFLLWQEPNTPPPHLRTHLDEVAGVMREHLSAMQQFTEFTRSTSRLQVLLRALPHGVVLTDEVSGTALVNEAAAQLLALAPGVVTAPDLAAAMSGLHERMSNADEVRLDGRSLFADSDGSRFNWVWEVVHPERRTFLVSTLPVHASGYAGRLWSFHEVTALRAAEEAQARLVRQLERERARVTELLASAPALIMLLRGPDHVIEFANDAMRAAAGTTDLVGQRLFLDHLPWLSGSDFQRAHDEVYRTGHPWSATALHLSSDQLGGRPEVYCNVSLQPICDADGIVTGIFAHSVDVTAQVTALEQLRQSQKLEAMGRLTGGVAHDFNNLLTVIGGNTEFLLAELTPTSQAHADATEVREAVRRASDLTRQLLSFSRRQVLQRHVVEIDQVVRGVERLLRRVIGEDITLETELGAGNATVMVDAGQLEQVLVNLAVNARDAMADGGLLTIRTSVQVTPPPGTTLSELRGAHLRIMVRDSGHGMDAATLARATETFFTTKPAGKGTGLGLALVKGIVEQHGGQLWIESTAGHGTSVWVALPLAAGSTTAVDAPPSAPVRQHAGRILLVEDESGVRHITRRILEDAGYEVQVAGDGREGISRWQEQSLDCVITDVVMPVLGGRAMVQAMRNQGNTTPVLFMSGYVEGGLPDEELTAGTAFLAKPFTAETLLAEVAALVTRM